MRKLFIAVLWIVSAPAFCQKAEIAIRINERDLIPEGITHDPQTGLFYMGSMYKRKVIQVTPTGKVSDFVATGQDGLGQPIGLHIDSKSRHLWICNIEGENKSGGKVWIHQYDLNSKKLIMKYEWMGENEVHLFNDLTVLSNGDVFITDSDYGAIYRINKDTKKLEQFLHSDQFRYSNGITATPDEKKIIVSAGSGLLSVAIETKEVEQIGSQGYLIIADGLYRYENSLIAVQNVFFPVSIVQFQLNPGFDNIERSKTLIVDHPEFDIPTTGVVVGDWFYFIANSQMRHLEQGVLKNAETLKDILIMRVKLKE